VGRRENRKIHPESNTEKSSVASIENTCENMGRKIEKASSSAAFKEFGSRGAVFRVAGNSSEVNG
jgi:hypothetical protein